MDPEVKALIDSIGKAHKEYRETNDSRLAVLEKKGVNPVDMEEKLGKLGTKLTELEEAKTKRENELKARVDQLEVTLKRAPTIVDKDGRALPADYKEAKQSLEMFMRKGENSGSETAFGREWAFKGFDVSKKALSVGSDPDGGQTVLSDLSGRIAKKVFETSQIRSVAAVQSIGTDALEGSYDLDEATTGWVSEQGTRAETATPQLKKWRIPVHEQYANPRATQSILDDSMVDLESWLAGKVADKMARTENDAFVNGNGVGKPRGFLTYSNGTTLPGTIEQIKSASNGAFTADGLQNLVWALKEPYRSRARIAFGRLGIAGVMKLKGTQNDHYIWQPSFQQGVPSTVLGIPIIEMNDLPALATSSLSAIIADWSEFYQIVDRQGVRILRDPYSAKPFVQFYTTKRVGGDVVNFEAAKIQNLDA